MTKMKHKTKILIARIVLAFLMAVATAITVALTPVKSSENTETESTVTAVYEAPAQEDFENQKIEAALLSKAHKIENCTVTWYCNSTCGKSPDNPAYGITASGEPTRPHCTVATDTSIIPMYSDVCVEYTDGTTEWFKATDTGVSGAHVDIYTEDYEQAIQNGVQLLNVWYIPPVEVETD